MPQIGPPASRRKRVLRALLAAGLPVAVGLAALLLIAVPVRKAVNRAAVANRRAQCANNLKNVGGMIQERMLSCGRSRRSAKTGILSAFTLGLVGRGDGMLFVCPMDPEGPTRMAAWSSGSTLPTQAEAADILTSYRYRDIEKYPFKWELCAEFPIAACLHHPDGVNVLYTDSSVGSFDRDDLELNPEDPIETGPDSKCELLRLFPARSAR